MIKSVKCYNYSRVIRMLNINHPNKMEELNDFLLYLDSINCEIFQPSYIKATSGPVRRPELYIKTNKVFDEFMKKQGTFAILKETYVKPTYRNYEIIKKETKNGLFEFE